MKRSLQFFVAAMVASSAAVFAQGPDINFDANIDLISLPAYGEVAGVATNSRGQIYVLARTGNPVATLGHERTFYHGGSRLFQFDASGKFVREVGQDMYGMTFGQQVRVDPQDNVWVVDAGSNILTKFDSAGNLLMVLGRKPEAINVRPGPGIPARPIDPAPAPPAGRGAAPAAGGGGAAPAAGGAAPAAGGAAPAAGGAAPPAAGGGGGGEGGGGAPSAPGAGQKSEAFSRPSDVTFDRAGNVYIADGFGNNNRIAVFNKDGNWVTGWGQTGTGQGQFTRIRGIASDAAGNIYVADSGNNRIQVFDSKGTFKSQITGIGTPMAICISGGATQYLFSSNSNDSESLDKGEIYKISLSGQVVGKFGKAGKLAKEFGMTNAIDCRTENNLLVGEVLNWRVQKVTLKQ